MSQSARLQYIIRGLSHGDGVTLKEIADEFDICIRQAGRDIEYLRNQMGAPIVFDRKAHRYRLSTIWDSYTNLDERVIITGAYLKSLFAKINLGPYFESEILDSLYSGISSEVKRVLDRIEYRTQCVDIPAWDIMSTIIDAFARNRCVDIVYTSLKDEETKRRIEPRRLINYNNSWYIAAYDYKRDETRTFHMSRIKSATLTSSPMVHDIEVSEATYGIFLSGHLRPYKIHFVGTAARIVASQIWSSGQKIEHKRDGSIILTVPASSPEELVPAILAYGDEAEPISPMSFVKAYRAKVDKLIAKYSNANESAQMEQ